MILAPAKVHSNARYPIQALWGIRNATMPLIEESAFDSPAYEIMSGSWNRPILAVSLPAHRDTHIQQLSGYTEQLSAGSA